MSAANGANGRNDGTSGTPGAEMLTATAPGGTLAGAQYMPAMPTLADGTTPLLIDFDLFAVRRIGIARTTADGQRREWALRDDLPLMQAFGYFELPQLQARIDRAIKDANARAASADFAEEDIHGALEHIRLAADALERKIYELGLIVFTHTYPETTAAQLREWFSMQDMHGVVQVFFQNRLRGSAPLPSAGNPSTPPPPNSSPTRKAAATRTTGRRTTAKRR